MPRPYYGKSLLGRPSLVRPPAQTLASYLAGLANTRMWLKLAETSVAAPAGNVADNAMYTAALGEEKFANSDFATWSGDNPSSWTVNSETGTTQEVTERAANQLHADTPGTGAANLFNSTGNSGVPNITQQPANVLGKTVQLEADVNYGSGTPQIGNGAGDFFHNANSTGVHIINGVLRTGDTLRARLVGAGDATFNYFSCKVSGELDGTYQGPTLNADTFMGLPCPTFDGTNDFVTLEFNQLETLLKPENAGFECTMMIPVLMSQAVWEATTARGFMSIGVDTNNRLAIYHSTTTKQVVFRHAFGGTAVDVTLDVDASHYAKFALLTLTISKPNSRFRGYINKTKGTDGAISAGTWSASALTTTWSRIGDIGGASFLAGSAASALIWDRELSESEISTIYNLMRAQEPDMS